MAEFPSRDSRTGGLPPKTRIYLHGIFFWIRDSLGDFRKTHQWYNRYILLTVGISPYEGYIGIGVHPCLSPQF